MSSESIISTLIFFAVHQIVTVLIWKSYFVKDIKLIKYVFIISAYVIFIIFACQRRIEMIDRYTYYGGVDNYNLKTYIFGGYYDSGYSLIDMLRMDTHEPLFIFINWLGIRLHTDFRFVLFVFGTSAYFFTVAFIHKIGCVGKAISSYIAIILVTGNLFAMLGMLRNYCAVSMVVFSYAEAKNKRYHISFVFIVLATMIHFSAAIGLVFLFAIMITDRLKRSDTKKIIVTAFVMLFSLSLIMMIGNELISHTVYGLYCESFNSGFVTASHLFFFVVPLLVFIMNIKENDPNLNVDALCIFISLFTAVLGIHFTMAYRFIPYVFPVVYLLAIELKNVTVLKTNKTRVCYVGTNALMMLFMLFRVYKLYFGDIRLAFPYSFWL